MKSKVIILESPAKAKTISSYFDNQILVLCSKGHIRDLSLKGKDRLGIDIQNNFKPYYQIIPEKAYLVKELIKKTKGKEILLATDLDREGEAIAWHLAQILELPTNDKNRIVFNEISKDVVLKAFNNPRKINQFLVDSQETRRIVDRIIGFKLSSLVRKINAKSAGRVQSVALKLIVDLEEERKKFVPEEYCLIIAFFIDFKASLVILPKNYKMKELEAKEILSQIDNEPLILTEIKTTNVINKPPKPFITASLQQEAFRHCSMSAKQTMINAQQLYEGINIDGKLMGLITYMRTDSLRLSPEFVKKTQVFIEQIYGKEYIQPYKNHTNDNNQDAHEAIRPTNFQNTPEKLKKYLNKYEWSLYNLIYQRYLASLMSSAIIQKTQYFFSVKNYKFVSEGNRIIFEGYYKSLSSIFKQNFLPSLELYNSYIPQKIEIVKKMTMPPARYTEASLIKKLESLKIGRPSTYSQIIEILKKRHYIYIEEKKMICTEIGKDTSQLLEKFFHLIINVKYTAQLEQQLDDICHGNINKITLLKNFYDKFKELFDIAKTNIKKVSAKIINQKCSLCNAFLVIRQSRYGEFLGCSNFPKCKYIKNDKKQSLSPMITNQNCSLCNAWLVIRKSRYGEFLGCSNFPKCKYISNLKKK
ncbi:MAG: type I DNA topoisomerase [Vigna little leaf phytoplasma]|nr:type I DNA topoisomerase [Vigna little leaf phytoplasma]